MAIERRIQVLDRVRMRLLSLDTRRPSDALLGEQRASIELLIAAELMRAKKYGEAQRVLLNTSSRIADLLRLHPSEIGLRHVQTSCLRELASICEYLGSPEASVQYCRQLLEIGDDESQSAPNPGAFYSCIKHRRELAWLLVMRGQRDEAARLIAANQRALDNPPAGYECHQLTVERVVCRIDMLEMVPGQDLTTPRGTGPKATAGSRALSGLEPLLSMAQTPAEWARLVAEGIRCPDPGSPASYRAEMENMLLLMDRLICIASRLRGLHDIERARRLAERMLALANDLVKATPREPAVHLARSFAYAQIYKNAYPAKDDAAIEANMKSAYDAAQDALRFDPGNELARYQVDELHRRLAARPRGVTSSTSRPSPKTSVIY